MLSKENIILNIKKNQWKFWGGGKGCLFQKKVNRSNFWQTKKRKTDSIVGTCGFIGQVPEYLHNHFPICSIEKCKFESYEYLRFRTINSDANVIETNLYFKAKSSNTKYTTTVALKKQHSTPTPTPPIPAIFWTKIN